MVDQARAIDEIVETVLEKGTWKDDPPCPPNLHTEYRRALRQLKWVQSRSQFQIVCRFSYAASAAASPNIADVRYINKVIRALQARPVLLTCWPLNVNLRLIGIPGAAYKNNEDKSSQRGLCMFLTEPGQGKETSTR